MTTIQGSSPEFLFPQGQGKTLRFNEFQNNSSQLALIRNSFNQLNSLIQILQKERLSNFKQKDHLDSKKILLSFNTKDITSTKTPRQIRLNAGNMKEELDFFLKGGYITERAVLETFGVLETAKEQKLSVIFNETREKEPQHLSVITNQQEGSPEYEQVISDFQPSTITESRVFSEEYKNAVRSLLKKELTEAKRNFLKDDNKKQMKTLEKSRSKNQQKEEKITAPNKPTIHKENFRKKEIQAADEKRRKVQRLKKEEFEQEKIEKSQEKHEEKLDRIKSEAKKSGH